MPQESIPDRIARKQRETREGTGATWVIERGGRLVGYVALHNLGQERVAISYALLPEAQGGGLAREAVAAIVAQGEALGFSEVEARTHHGNEPSVRLLLAVGFTELEPVDSPPRRRFLLARP